MKYLVVSDSHTYNDLLNQVIKHYPNIDGIIHCGDSSFEKDSPYLSLFDCIVEGNHDFHFLPLYQILEVNNHRLFITHGHKYNVYLNYNELIKAAKKYHCDIIIHGHTHVPTFQVHNHIICINPGSIMMNRGSYGFGTYALLEISDKVTVHFYHHTNHIMVDSIVLEEGIELLKTFQLYAEKKI